MYNNNKSELKDFKKKNFRVKEIKGDGDCLYNAVLQSLKYSNFPNLPDNSTELRRILLEHADKFKWLKTTTKEETIKRIKKGITDIGDTSSWGENEEIDLLADYFNTCICVWVKAIHMWIYAFPQNLSNALMHGVSKCTNIVFLINVGGKSKTTMGSHFETLIPLFTDLEKDNGSNSNSSSNSSDLMDEVITMELSDFEQDDEELYDEKVEDTDDEQDDEELYDEKVEDTDDDEKVEELYDEKVEDTDDDEEIEDTDDDEEIEDTDDDEEIEDTDDDEEIEDTDDDVENKRIDNAEDLTLTKDEQKEVQRIRKQTLTKRYEYYKQMIYDYENTTNYDKNRSLFRISNDLKTFNESNRLEEYPEYFIDNTEKINNVEGFSFTNNQKLLKKFMSANTHNMGILLYHGVGVGKTCSSILIAENFVNLFDKEVLVFLPSSLESNYRKELFDVSRLNVEKQKYDACNGNRYLEMIPGWSKMSKSEINKKVQKMINNDYKFYGYLKIVNVVSKIHRLCKQKHGNDKNEVKLELFMRLREMFSNRVIIIDEIHNIRLSDDVQMKKFPKILKLILKCGYNIRLIMLSATPMFDDPVEISWIMDFLFTNDKYYKKQSSTVEFDKDSKLTKESKKNIIYFAKNYVSFVRGYDPKYFPIMYYNTSKIDGPKYKYDMLKHKNRIEPLNTDKYDFFFSSMMGNQLETYNMFFQSKKKQNVQFYIQMSNIVYPSKMDDLRYSVGKGGFNNIFEKDDKSKLLKVKYKSKKHILDLKYLKEVSSKIYDIITEIENAQGLVLIYSKFLYSGLIPIGIALEHLGYSKYNNNNILLDNVQTKSTKQYIMITADDSLSPNNVEELRIFNDQANRNGDKIKIALINEIASEGVSFRNVRQLHILEPWYNMKKTDQIIGRGVRYKSHEWLDKQQQNIGIFLHVNITNSKIESIDYRRYRIALRKLSKIKQIEDLMQQYAIDCHFNENTTIKMKNKIKDSKNEERIVVSEYNNMSCMNKVIVPNVAINDLNEQMITFDLIELSKKIRTLVEQKEIYMFDLKTLRNDIDHMLLKPTLMYMVKSKMKIWLKNVKGYFIMRNDTYYFQPEEIDDTTLSISDRQASPRKYVKRILLDKEYKKDSTDTTKSIQQRIKELETDFTNVLTVVNKDIIEDMIIDRLSENEYKHIFQNKEYLESLRRGKYMIDMGDKQGLYNIYTDEILSTENKIVGYVNRKKYFDILKEQITKSKTEDVLGFIDVVSSGKDQKVQVLKIKHLENKKKIVGSACITTSTLKLETLKSFIEEVSGKQNLNLKNIKKRLLCYIYEYLLRETNKFARPIEYKIIKN
jgi:hypothetical protein